MAAYLVQNKDGSMCLAVEACSQEDALLQAFPEGKGALPDGVSVTNVTDPRAPVVAAAPVVVPAPPPTKDELPHAHDSEPEEPKA